MSRMTKFLKQDCTLEQLERDSAGKPVLNRFGEFSYLQSATIKCRRERTTQDVQTSNGSIIKSVTRYFTDQHVLISPDDKLDGHVVLEVAEYINQLGRVEGYESYV